MKFIVIEELGENERAEWTFYATRDGLKLTWYCIHTREFHQNKLWEETPIHFIKTKTVWSSFLDPAFGNKQPKIPARIMKNVRRQLVEWAQGVRFVPTLTVSARRRKGLLPSRPVNSLTQTQIAP